MQLSKNQLEGMPRWNHQPLYYYPCQEKFEGLQNFFVCHVYRNWIVVTEIRFIGSFLLLIALKFKAFWNDPIAIFCMKTVFLCLMYSILFSWTGEGRGVLRFKRTHFHSWRKLEKAKAWLPRKAEWYLWLSEDQLNWKWWVLLDMTGYLTVLSALLECAV